MRVAPGQNYHASVAPPRPHPPPSPSREGGSRAARACPPLITHNSPIHPSPAFVPPAASAPAPRFPERPPPPTDGAVGPPSRASDVCYAVARALLFLVVVLRTCRFSRGWLHIPAASRYSSIPLSFFPFSLFSFFFFFFDQPRITRASFRMF